MCMVAPGGACCLLAELVARTPAVHTRYAHPSWGRVAKHLLLAARLTGLDNFLLQQDGVYALEHGLQGQLGELWVVISCVGQRTEHLLTIGKRWPGGSCGALYNCMRTQGQYSSVH